MTIKDAKNILKYAASASDTVIIKGDHGLGKSAIVRQYAIENGYFYKDLFLSMLDVGDLLGIPRTQQVGSSLITTWAEPDWFQQIVDAAWPQHFSYSSLVFHDSAFSSYCEAQFETTEFISRDSLNTAYCNFYKLFNDQLYLTTNQSNVSCSLSRVSTLFLDELNRANIDVRQACLQLILEKELHCHKLPYVNGTQTFIVAAINPDDKYQVDALDPALLDRFLNLEITVDVPSWLEWANSNDINPIITGFISQHPQYLHHMPETDKGATPRSWAKLSSYLANFETTPIELQMDIVKGKIGLDLAAIFITYLRDSSKIISVKDIESAVKKAKSTDIPKLVAAVKPLLDKQEAIQHRNLADQLYTKYVNKPASDAYPLAAVLHALPLESLAATLKDWKSDNFDNFSLLMAQDLIWSNKALVKKAVGA